MGAPAVIVLLLLLAVPRNGMAQRTPCTTFIHGTFEEGTHTKQEVLSGKPAGVRIVRHGRGHVETDRATRVKVRYTVRWTEDCTFLLFDRKDKQGMPGRAWAASDTITVRIVDTWPEGFAYERTQNWDGTKDTGEMKMIVPKGGGISFGL
jgi:hypothetical protein